MNTTIIALITFFLISTTGVSAAQGQGMGDIDRVQDPTVNEVTTSPVPQGNAVSNQAKTATQNQGEEQNLQIMTQDQAALQDGLGEGSQGINAKMSQVASSVQNLLNMGENAKGGIGQQVSEIATSQLQSQNKIEASLIKLEQKTTFAKRLFCPDYRALKELRGELTQNQLRIEALQELMTQTENAAELTQLELAIQNLTDQDVALAEQVSSEETIPSLFGWFVRLFNR